MHARKMQIISFKQIMIFALPEIKSDNRFEAGFSLRSDSIMFLFDLQTKRDLSLYHSTFVLKKTIILFVIKFAQSNRDR